MSGHKLADGSWSSEYKIGDKFEVVDVAGLGEHYRFCVGSIVTLTEDDDSHYPYFEASLECVGWSRLKPYKEPAKQFTKSDLLDGMRVMYRDGEERVVFGDFVYKVYDDEFYLMVGLEHFKDDLTYRLNDRQMDIMKVTDRDGTVLFTRQEVPAKSPAQIELDKLQEQIAALQQQADKLQQSL